MVVRRRRYGGTPQTALADYVAEHAKQWVASWLEAVRRDETTAHYHDYPHTDELLRDTEALYHYLGMWLRSGEWDPRIDPHYQRIGRVRRQEGFRLSEVVSAILLAKRQLWEGISSGRPLSVALELEVQKALRLFYDRAIYNTVRGYEEAAAYKEREGRDRPRP